MDFKNLSSRTGTPIQKENPSGIFKEFDATELYCPRCKQAVPVRKRLLLVLPEGDMYEYRCAFCSESVGTKIDRSEKPTSIII
jgi:hypothetical protein